MLLDQGERIRACLFTLRALRQRLEDFPEAAASGVSLDQFFAAAGRVLEADGEMLRTGQPWDCGKAAASNERNPVAELERVFDSFCASRAGNAPPVLTKDIETQMDALARQLRVTFDLANNATPSGRQAFAPQRRVKTVAVAPEWLARRDAGEFGISIPRPSGTRSASLCASRRPMPLAGRLVGIGPTGCR